MTLDEFVPMLIMGSFWVLIIIGFICIAELCPPDLGHVPRGEYDEEEIPIAHIIPSVEIHKFN